MNIRNSNRKEVEASNNCYCISCQTWFPPSEIHSYTDSDDIPLCPYCSADTVIGDRSGIREVDDWIEETQHHYFDYEDSD